METIKHGNKNAVLFKGTCKECGCKVEVECNELETKLMYPVGLYAKLCHYAICPECFYEFIEVTRI